MTVKPFLKWAGGKGKSLPAIAEAVACLTWARYFEPFLGGGAVALGLPGVVPERAVLADSNSELVNAWTVVRDEVDELALRLTEHSVSFFAARADYYYSVRALDPDALPPVARAARTIFLNRTCFNGMYRQNKRGEFNVPIGRYKNPRICNEPLLRAVSAHLRGVEIVEADFEETIERAGDGDLVYGDPPYVPVSDTADFTSYTGDGFGTPEHVRLLAAFRRLDERGGRFLLSSSDAYGLSDRYLAEGWLVDELSVRRNVNRNKDGRGPVTELLVRNFE